MVNDEDIPHIKKGIKLPKSNFQWSTANDYFKSKPQSQDLNTNIKFLNNIIYDYFADNFGYACSSPENSLVNKYKDCTIKDLKKALKTFKSTNTHPDEIKYVSHILRAKLRVRVKCRHRPWQGRITKP